jgi:hypothetical protein
MRKRSRKHTRTTDEGKWGDINSEEHTKVFKT